MKASDKAMISTYINSAIAAVAPLFIGYVNPKNKAYGIGKNPEA